MKTILIFFMAFSLTTTPATIKSDSTEPTTVLVLMDQTGSIAQDEHVKKKYKKVITAYLKTNIKNAGDKVVLSYIFERTLSHANRQEFIFSPPTAPDFDNMHGARKKQAIYTYKQKLSLYKQILINKVVKKVFSPQANGQHTRLLAGLGLMQELASNSKGEYKALILSDMIEESEIRNTKYNHPRNTIKNRATALVAAQKDITKIKKAYAVDNLSSYSNVTCVLPTVGGSLHKRMEYELMPVYFTKLFELLKAPQPVFK